MLRPGTRERRYLALAALVIVVYAVVGAILHASKDFDERGPLSYLSSATADVPGGALTAAEASKRCWPQFSPPTFDYVFVTGKVHGESYLACYKIDVRTAEDDQAVVLVDAHGIRVKDVEVLKATGVWPWVAVVSTSRGLVAGFITVAAVVAGDWFY